MVNVVSSDGKNSNSIISFEIAACIKGGEGTVSNITVM